MGNIIWVGWCPESKRKSVLSKGSHLIMCNKSCIKHISNAMRSGEIERGHIDLVLKHWLQTKSVAQQVGACYTYPQMGGFFDMKAAVILGATANRREDDRVHGKQTPQRRGPDSRRTKRGGASTSSSGEGRER